MPGEPGPAPPPSGVEAWSSAASFGEASRISVPIIVLAVLCPSAGSTFASPGGQSHTWPPTAQTTGLDQVSDPGIAARLPEPHPLRPLRAVEQCRSSVVGSPGHQLADPDHQQWSPHKCTDLCGRRRAQHRPGHRAERRFASSSGDAQCSKCCSAWPESSQAEIGPARERPTGRLRRRRQRRCRRRAGPAKCGTGHSASWCADQLRSGFLDIAQRDSSIQPGGHLRPGRRPRVPVAAGPGLLRRATARRHPGRPRQLGDLRRQARLGAGPGHHSPRPRRVGDRGAVRRVVITAALLVVVLSTAVYQRAPGGAMPAGLAIGLWIGCAVFLAFPISGGSLNPARTLGPDIVSAAFPSWWIYLVGPLAGAAFGGWIWQYLKQGRQPTEAVETDKDTEPSGRTPRTDSQPGSGLANSWWTRTQAASTTSLWSRATVR